MSETTPESTPATEAPAEETPATETPAEQPAEETTPGEEALGDPGKKALEAMKAERKAAREEAARERAAREELQAKLEGHEAEHKAAQEAQRVQDEAIAKANDRILKAEVRAAAASKLADPADALRFLDLSEFEVGSDGEVDADAVASAIDTLVQSKPYLAAQGSRFQGTADGGTRTGATKPSQLSRADLASMTSDQINQARSEGRLADLLGVQS